LLALRGLARLDGAVKAGNLKADSPAVKQVREDADAAVKAGAVGEGNYTLGRLAEELGDLPAAVKYYQLAVAKYSGQKKLEAVYRLALARVLLQAKPAEDKKGGKGEDKKAQGGKRKRALPVLAVNPVLLTLNATMLLVQEDEEEPYQNPNVDQAIKLAQEAIERGEPEGYLVLGQALTQKGKWTEGLMVYITGLEKTVPGTAAKGLRRIVEGHPAFKRPDSVKPPQPLLAQKFYSNGLNFYWNRKFDKAEAEFLQAVKYFDQDARYFYFLGLSRLRQQKADKLASAYEDFRLAHRLEEEGNPEPDTVSDALEKVQGKARRVLDGFRKPRPAE
jgi:tetratricopeptide (TPR) repeat protein